MTRAECPTVQVAIFIAGDVAAAKEECRKYCFEVGLCVTVDPTTFIYTGGEEVGVRVGLINYARYPSDIAGLEHHAFALADKLRARLCQHSFSIVGPDRTIWDSSRDPEDKP